jgi:hypothetical protein
MIADNVSNADRWLRQQSSIIPDLFEKAAVELEASGIRLLAGSVPPIVEECDNTKRVGISPLRFSKSNTEEFLSLSLLASIRGGPLRYTVSLRIRGDLTREAFQKLANEYAAVWSQAYLTIGLWIGGGGDWELLNHLDQLSLTGNAELNISGTFLHSDMTRRIQDGLLLMAVLYRSMLDELAGAGKMSRLYAQLSNRIEGRKPTFQRIIRP